MGLDRTLRQEIAELLTTERLTAREISQTLKVREREVIEHLEHIVRSVSKKGYFRIEPSVCRKCGFIFKDRKRLRSPGRCPLCKNEAITEPRFWIENKR
ncbi:MAG: transcriptional regulator [Nitrospirae bacterium]|nr:transcriptional regulator [Nitrospirota bacterium]